MKTNKTALLVGSALIGAALTRAITAEQINENRDQGPLRRTAELRNVDVEARTVEVAFSSETPVARWFGDEVLDHAPGAMIEDRLRNGAAVLWNHNPDVQIGVVESSRVDDDRRGRAVLRFGASSRAEEIWADVQAGVIRHISVGYFVRAVRTEEREGEPDQVTITEWEPYEISLVSIPADASVGVGRSMGKAPEEGQQAHADTDTQTEPHQTEGSGHMERILRNAAGDLVRARVDDNGNIVEVLETLETAAETRALTDGARNAEHQRAASLIELGDQYGATAEAATAIRDNTSVEEFTRSLVDVVAARPANGNGNRALDDNDGMVGLTDAEVGEYSFLRALNALANPNDRRAQEAAAFEREASDAAAQASGRQAQGIMVPADVMRRALNTGTAGGAAGDTGGYAIGTTLLSQSFVAMLRNRSVLLSMATPLGGLVGNVDIPTQISGATGYWLGEDDDTTETNGELGQFGMSPKTVGAFTEITRKLLVQSSLDMEAFVRADLARALATTIDHAGFYGTGSANQPLGIKNVPGVNAVPFAAVQPTFAELVGLESEVAADNADVDSMAYVANAKFRGHCKTTEKFGGSNGATIWEQGNTVNGYRTEITNQIVDGDVFHGNFADMLIATWGGLDLTVDPYSNSKKGRVRIVAFQDVDNGFRHNESFAYGAKPVV